MHYTLFDYQEAATRGVLKQLGKARDIYRAYDERTSFALAACTGAGKTVIASAVVEALFNGSTEYDVEPDPTAVVLWLTDDESLNNQTRERMLQASELHPSQLISIENGDFPELFDPLTVYFLNVQKLYDKSTNYVKPSNSRPWSLWDTIRNTAEELTRTLYLVLDEAHKGMGNGKQKRSTTVLRLVNGEGGRPPVPIVWGISATPERFQKAMEGATGRTTRETVEVAVGDVQESGLLKDTIILSVPGESGKTDTTLLRSAVTSVQEQTKRWETYCAEQKLEPVVPLLVVQVNDKPSAAQLKTFVGTIREEWPELVEKNVRHVFGERADIDTAGFTIRHVEPENVQAKKDIRVLLAMNAVNTGWDCPRAEVLFSARGGRDRTFITQFIGRMVRTPLARRIPSDELLNSVMCLLPHFDAQTTDEVAKALTNREYDADSSGTGAGGGSGGQRVLRDPVTLTRNGDVPQEVFDAFALLPAETKPEPAAKPVSNLFAAAVALAGDGLLADANAKAYSLLFDALDAIYNSAEHKKEIEEAIADVETVDVAVTKVSLADGAKAKSALQLTADTRAIDDSFSVAARAITKNIATRYQRFRAERDADPDGNLDLIRAKVEVSALGSLDATRAALDAKASAVVKDWMATYDSAIRALDDERKVEYNRIKGRAGVPLRRAVVLPATKLEPTKDRKGENLLPIAKRHLLADGSGNYPLNLNGPEGDVVHTELARTGPGQVIGWYRNPSSATENALSIPYRKADDTWTTAQPDFIFFQRKADGTVIASVVDPHGTQFNDGIERLRGFATFVESYPDAFAGFESLAHNKAGDMMKLNLLDKATRDAIRGDGATDESLFNGDYATKYV